MNEQQRQLINRRQLTECHPAFALKVDAILHDLEGYGWLPYVADAWRSPAEQLRKFQEGRSKVRYSFHNATSSDGDPEALAADIVDARYNWNAPKKFWLMLAASAIAHGCHSGIFFGLDKEQNKALSAAIVGRNWSTTAGLGWDAAHVQFYPNSKLAAVRKGLRP